jgi:hypothetical protein
VDELEARLSLIVSGSSRAWNGALRIEELSLGIKPTVLWHENMNSAGLNQALRHFTAHHQSPAQREATVAGLTSTEEWGGAFRAGYPQPGISVEVTRKKGISRARPVGNGIDFDFDKIEIGIHEGNQFLWRYPLQRHTPYYGESKSVRLGPHSGTIAYQTDTPPDKIKITTTMVCSLTTANESIGSHSNIKSKTKRFLRFLHVVRDGGKDFPCRHVRFRLHTDVVPNETNQFNFNSATGASIIDLGQHSFFEENGVIVLEIHRKENTPLKVPEPHRWVPKPNYPMKRGLWEATAEKPGSIRFSETAATGQDVTVRTELELDLNRGPNDRKI